MINYANFLSNCACTFEALPTKTTDSCECTTWSGRINDIYFISCEETVNATNLVDTAWWQALIDNNKIFNTGIGVGSFQQSNITTFDKGGCGTATVEQITWDIVWKQYCIDQSSEYYTHSFYDTLLKGAYKNYNVVLRTCGGPTEAVIPIGKTNLSNINMIIPESTEEFMSLEFTLSFKGLWLPSPLTVAGLDAVLPKAA